MSNPWDDFAQTAAAEEPPPWEDFSPAPEPVVETHPADDVAKDEKKAAMLELASKIKSSPTGQPSQFSSGRYSATPIADNPDWAFTKSISLGADAAAKSEAAKIIGRTITGTGQDVQNVLIARPSMYLGGGSELLAEEKAAEEIKKRSMMGEAGVVPEKTPYEKSVEELPAAARITTLPGNIVAETLPQLAIGAINPVAGAISFGFTPEGFDPKQAALMLIAPPAGHAVGGALEKLAVKLGVKTESVLAGINKIGGATGVAGFLSAPSVYAMAQMPEGEEKEKAKQNILENAVALGAMSMTGGRFVSDKNKNAAIAADAISQLVKHSESAGLEGRQSPLKEGLFKTVETTPEQSAGVPAKPAVIPESATDSMEWLKGFKSPEDFKLNTIINSAQVNKNENGDHSVVFKTPDGESSSKVVYLSHDEAINRPDVQEARDAFYANPENKGEVFRWDGHTGADNTIYLNRQRGDRNSYFTHETVHLMRNLGLMDNAQMSKILSEHGTEKIAQDIKAAGIYAGKDLGEEAVARILEGWHRDRKEIPSDVKGWFDTAQTFTEGLQNYGDSTTKFSSGKQSDPTRKEPYSEDDLALYQKLKSDQKQLLDSGSAIVNGEYNPEFLKSWQDYEKLRNKYNGNPPAQLFENATTKAIKVESLPKSNLYRVIPNGAGDPFAAGKLGRDAYLMTSDGRFLEVTDHEPAAAVITGGKYNPDDSWMDRHSDALRKKGWARIMLTRSRGSEESKTMHVGWNPSAAQLRELKSLAIENQMKLMLDVGGSGSKVLYDPSEGSKFSVNKAEKFYRGKPFSEVRHEVEAERTPIPALAPNDFKSAREHLHNLISGVRSIKARGVEINFANQDPNTAKKIGLRHDNLMARTIHAISNPDRKSASPDKIILAPMTENTIRQADLVLKMPRDTYDKSDTGKHFGTRYAKLYDVNGEARWHLVETDANNNFITQYSWLKSSEESGRIMKARVEQIGQRVKPPGQQDVGATYPVIPSAVKSPGETLDSGVSPSGSPATTLNELRSPTADSTDSGKATARPVVGQESFLEVAPNPEDAALTSRWNSMPYEDKQRVSKNIADKIIPQVLEHSGVKAEVSHDIGYFGGANPNVRLDFSPETSYDKAREATVKAGYVLRQQAVIVADERVGGEGSTKFMRVVLGEGYDDAKGFMESIGESGSRLSDGSFIYGNFSGRPDSEFFGDLTKKLGDSKFENTHGFKSFKSDYVDNLEAAVKLYEDANKTGGNESAVVREQAGGLDSLKAKFAAEFEAAIPKFSGGRKPAEKDFGDLQWWKRSEFVGAAEAGSHGVSKQRTLAGNSRELVPGEKPDGTVKISHWSHARRDLIDPKFYGKGIVGEEGKRRIFKDHWLNRSYFGIEGYSKEGGLGKHRHDIDIPAEKLYDIQNDPDGLLDSALKISSKKYPKGGSDAKSTVYENLIKKAGYDGYFSRDHRIAASFVPQRVKMSAGRLEPKTPSEDPHTPTSIKNAIVEKEREQRGLPSAIQPARRDFGTVWDDAMSAIDADPNIQDRLISNLRSNPRSATDFEDAILLHRQIELQNKYGRLTQEQALAHDEGRLEDAKAIKGEIAEASDELLDLYNINKKVGTETGRGLNARKMMAHEDYSLAKMELDKRTANDGRALTDSERSELVSAHEKIARLQKDYDAYVSKSEQRIADAELAKSIAEIKAQSNTPVEPHVRIIADKIRGYFDKRSVAAQKRLDGQLFTISPVQLVDLIDLGASRILAGSIDFGVWSADMLSRLDKSIKPHLRMIWEKSQSAINEKARSFSDSVSLPKVRVEVRSKKPNLDEIVNKISENIKAEDFTGASALVKNLVRHFVEAGIVDREALVDAVHAKLVEILPDMTRRETMDAISGYGNFKRLSKDEISVKIRDLKGQMQQAAKLDDMQSGHPPLKTGMERRNPSLEEKRLIHLVNEAKRQFQIPISDPDTQLKSSLDTLKALMKTKTEKYQQQLRDGDFSKKEKRVIQLDKEANKISYDLAVAKRNWHEAMMRDRLAKRNIAQKIFAGAGELLNTSRAVMTSFDLSAVLRQGGFITLGHPVRAARAFPAMFDALRSPEGQHRVDQEILHRKNYPMYARSKLYLSEHGHKLSQMEEAYMTRWADKIPGVAASQRAYVTFLNRLRADSFDALSKTLSMDGELTQKEADAIADFVNVATGRGTGESFARTAVGLNTIFFAPRLALSRFQLLAGQPMYRGTAGTRKLIAGEYARFLIGVGIIYGMGSMAGATIEIDPRSSDFGKLKFGNTRLDLLSGLAQATTFVARFVTGKTKKQDGRIAPAKDTVKNFLRNKFSPAFGAAADVRDLMRGEKPPVGHAQSVPAVLGGLAVPIGASDIVKAMKEQGVVGGTALSLISLLGAGMNTYSGSERLSQ